MNKLLSQRSLRIALLCIFVGLLIAGLQPFNFNPKNDAHWFQTQNGIRFGGYGQVYGTDSLGGLTSNSNELTVELLVSSYKGRKASIESLINVLSPNNEQAFAIEIWTIDLVIAGWFHNSATGRTAYDRLFCGQVFERKDDRFITVTSGSDSITVYVDGVAQRSYPRLTLASENFDGRLLLGQPADGHQEWSGGIKGFAVFNKLLSAQQIEEDYKLWEGNDTAQLASRSTLSTIFNFDERRGRVIRNLGTVGGVLELPEDLLPVHPEFLKTPTARDIHNWSDVSLNVVGFIPFGLVLVVYLRSTGSGAMRAILISIVISFLISILIEVLQVYLPSRDSSLLDLMMNTLGGFIGACLGEVLCRGILVRRWTHR
jgi:VanZ family protein